MAEVRINPDDPTADESNDIEMQGGDADDDVIEVGETGAAAEPARGEEEPETGAEEDAPKPAPRVTFVE